MKKSVTNAKGAVMNQVDAQDALRHIAITRVEGVIVIGDVDRGLLEKVVRACRPAPVKVACYNAPDELAHAAAAAGAVLRVGVATATREPKLTVQTHNEKIAFRETVVVLRSRPGWITEIYEMLVPFDGVSLASSTADVTPARKEVLAWLAGSAQGLNPTLLAYGRLRTSPKVRTALFAAGGLCALLGLFFPAGTLFLVAGIFFGAFGLGVHIDLYNLHKRFGTGHV